MPGTQFPLRLGSQIASFSAHKNGTDQTGIADATYTKVTWPTEAYDVGGFFASDKWTPPAGKVRMTAAVRLQGTGATSLDLQIYKNGATYKALFSFGTFSDLTPLITADDAANGTDYYEVYAYMDVASGTITASGFAWVTYFMGAMI